MTDLYFCCRDCYLATEIEDSKLFEMVSKHYGHWLFIDNRNLDDYGYTE